MDREINFVAVIALLLVAILSVATYIAISLNDAVLAGSAETVDLFNYFIP
jgi:hypothetical protein